MSENKYKITKIESLRLIDRNTGEVLLDYKDKGLKELKPAAEATILALVQSCVPTKQLKYHPLINKYRKNLPKEDWQWSEELLTAPNDELWQIYALIHSELAANYKRLYEQEWARAEEYKEILINKNKQE